MCFCVRLYLCVHVRVWYLVRLCSMPTNVTWTVPRDHYVPDVTPLDLVEMGGDEDVGEAPDQTPHDAVDEK